MMSTLQMLQQVLEDRKAHPRPGSYTNQLLADPEEAVKKVGEEAVEVILASLQQGRERLISEAADLTYHLLVVLTAHGIAWEEIEGELERRRGP